MLVSSMSIVLLIEFLLIRHMGLGFFFSVVHSVCGFGSFVYGSVVYIEFVIHGMFLCFSVVCVSF